MIRVRVRNSQRTLRIPIPRVRALAKRTLRSLRFTDGELSISLVADAEIRGLNARCLGRDRATNVLSFSLRDGDYGDVNPGVLGDVVVSTDAAARQAGRSGNTPEREVSYLVIHGILHLLGHDHLRERSRARAMSALQERLFWEHGHLLDADGHGR